jgi:hypothetical protein
MRARNVCVIFQDDMNLGDMVVSVPYVLKQMNRDAQEASEVGPTEWALDRRETRGVSGAMMGYLGGPAAADAADEGATAAPPGAAAPLAAAALQRSRQPQPPLSGARAAALQARVALLLAHGLLHLLGHDHEHTPDNDGQGDGDGSGGHEDRGEACPRAEVRLSAAQAARVEAMYELMVAEEERLVAGLRDLLPPEG